ALLLNALVVFSVFFAARALGLRNLAAIAAAIVVALVSPFPAALLDVARFPQTAGLVILPVAAVLTMRLARAAPSGLSSSAPKVKSAGSASSHSPLSAYGGSA